MPREARAYLLDVIEACEAISSAVRGIDLDAYRRNRLVRSSVEREFIIIGEAMGALSRHAADMFAQITRARRIVDFRNQLTHEYATVDDTVVWVIATRDVPVLWEECARLLASLERSDGG
jgi:uncharacterized protein with HEPN domain